MPTHQEITRTPDYDPRKNSSTLNFFLSKVDGGYQRGTSLCQGANELLYSKTITIGQFPLYTESYRKGFGVTSILLGLLGISAIIATLLSPLSLFISISAVILILFSVFTGLVYFEIPRLQHRYVLVELECEKCKGDHAVLYDAITKMKRRRFGRYTEQNCIALQVSPAKRTYEFIEAAFEEMPKCLSPIPGRYDCQDFADELYMKIM